MDGERIEVMDGERIMVWCRECNQPYFIKLDHPELWPLFDAAGPEREPDKEPFGNPKKHPSKLLPRPPKVSDLEQRIAELEAALKPFAEYVQFADKYSAPANYEKDERRIGMAISNITGTVEITYGDCRRAAAVLNRSST